MKQLNKNKKGFTLVELIIVIAIIGILAAVLIPTFSGVMDKAKVSAAEQEAINTYKESYMMVAATASTKKTVYIQASETSKVIEMTGSTVDIGETLSGYTFTIESGDLITVAFDGNKTTNELAEYGFVYSGESGAVASATYVIYITKDNAGKCVYKLVKAAENDEALTLENIAAGLVLATI